MDTLVVPVALSIATPLKLHLAGNWNLGTWVVGISGRVEGFFWDSNVQALRHLL